MLLRVGGSCAWEGAVFARGLFDLGGSLNRALLAGLVLIVLCFDTHADCARAP